MKTVFGDGGIIDADSTLLFESLSDDLKVKLQTKHHTFQDYFDKHLKPKLQSYVFQPSRKNKVNKNWTNNNAVNQ